LLTHYAHTHGEYRNHLFSCTMRKIGSPHFVSKIVVEKYMRLGRIAQKKKIPDQDFSGRS